MCPPGSIPKIGEREVLPVIYVGLSGHSICLSFHKPGKSMESLLFKSV